MGDSKLIEGINDADKEKLLARLRSRQSAKQKIDCIPECGKDRRKPFPASNSQRRLWFLSQIEGVSSTYHVPFHIRLKGALSIVDLQKALDAIVRRHEALRTTFVLVDGEPFQHVGEASTAVFQLQEREVFDEKELDCILAEVMLQPFDLSRGPLCRGMLTCLPDGSYDILIVMHHIVSDGWSMNVFAADLSTLYNAYRRGDSNPEHSLPRLEIQYPDYSVWQRAGLGSAGIQAQAAYWRSALNGSPALLVLPYDRPRPRELGYGGATCPFELDERSTRALINLSTRNGITLFMAVLAGWASLLSRLSGQEDIVIGLPSANRGRSEVEGLIGYFANTIALRLDLSGDPTIPVLLDRIKLRILEAQSNADIPFESVVETVNPGRNLSYTPLFQVMLTWQDSAGMDAHFEGLERCDPAPLPHYSSAYDLTLSVGESDGCIRGALEYSTALFDRGTAMRILDYLRCILVAMPEYGPGPIGSIALLSKAERQRMVATRKPAVLPFLEGERLHDAVGRWAARTPSAIAAEHVGQSISYAELWEWSDRLAVRLRDLGVKPRRNVVVILERGFGLLAALLAISKAGGASVPIDMHSPKERAQAILEESDPAAVLTEDWTMETAGSPLFAAVRPSEFQFKGIREWPSGEGDPTPPKAEDAAAILYTSGSTGVPKGVVLPHRAFVAFISGHVSMMGLGPGARVLQFASPAFDVAFEEVFGALSSGSTLVIRTDEWLADSGKFWKLCSDHRISFADLPARFWRSIVVDAKADPPDCLLSVIIGGEAAPRDALEAWFQKPGRLPRLYNAYGPTEATVSATIREMTADPSGWSSIGRPLPNVDVYILDKRLEPVPVGIVGELYIGGRGLAEGYLKRPELTAQRFLSDPFTGGTIYRTGDLGRWMPDGTIDFIGRNDSQVKLRGFRIELGEVETRLLDESGIRYAVATVREDIPGDQRLVAYVVCDADADLVALRGRLRASLPDYMIPSTICRIESIPLTSGGKPDRAALPLPEPSKVSEVHRCDDPDGEIEVALADIWIDLLKVVKVGRGDDFFDLGGHSLLGIRLSTRITEVFSVAFGIKDVFAARSLRGMAEIIIDRQLSQYGFE